MSDATRARWWSLLWLADGLLFVGAVALWLAGREPLAGLAFVLAIGPPLAVIGVSIDGRPGDDNL